MIEHFYEGYGAILDEMTRVIRMGGFLFLTFPVMSFLRKIKAHLGYYSNIPITFDAVREHFYQFALNSEMVIDDLNHAGFRLITEIGYDGLKGFKDEADTLKSLFLQRIYDSSSLLSRGFQTVIEPLISPWCGHCILLVLEKETS